MTILPNPFLAPVLSVSSESATQPAAAPTARAAAGLSHNPVTHAVEVPRHLIHHAGRLALPPFRPDFPAMEAAMHDENAPRTSLDPVWADPSPMFLKMVRS